MIFDVLIIVALAKFTPITENWVWFLGIAAMLKFLIKLSIAYVKEHK